MRVWAFLAAVSPILFLGACNLAPDYAPPAVEMPETFKEAQAWGEARPSDDEPRGAWWLVFGDRTLNDLEPQVELANQDLAAALATIDQAQAFVAKAEAGLLPTLQLENALSSNKQSAHRPLRKANTPPAPNNIIESFLSGRPINEPDHYGNDILRLQSSYEVDLWGRVRNAVATAQAQAAAQSADIYSVRLSLEAELAREYVNLRHLDSEEKLLRDTIESYKEALALTKLRVEGQIASPADVPRAQAQLETVKAQLADLLGRRALLEHAIATLTGRPASSFSIARSAALPARPVLPAAVPSTLLERRPDIAAAERRVAAANQSIGIARAAFFPRVAINLSGGTQDTGLSLLNLKYSVWSVGPSVTLPIFDAGARLADLAGAEAVYAGDVAHYRATVLRAIQDVEDELALLKWARNEMRSVRALVASTQKVLDTSLTLYRDGAVTYLDVVTAQTATLDAQRTLLALKTRQLLANVSLILALGGGWSSNAANGEFAHIPRAPSAERPI